MKRTELNASWLGAGVSQTWVLPTVNVVPYYYATLIVRVHDATWTASAALRVDGYASYPTPEDAREFADTSSRIAATVSYTTTLPAFATGTDSNLPVAYKFVAKLTQGTASAGFFVVASADLLLRGM
jgi:hypothetical protein